LGFPSMQTPTQYETFAEECDRLANEAQAERHRIVLKEMAEAWRKLAEGGGQNRRTAPPLAFYCFSGMCCVFFREAKPDLRHVQQDGLVCRAFGGACQLHAFLPEPPILFCRSHTGMPHAPMQRGRTDGVPSPRALDREFRGSASYSPRWGNGRSWP
jgi:hypothetical protein